ncbi:Ribonucleoside-diphosphate reductase large subunit [Hordeum vulgare]|nr:Ribonucleoside-diphosphate reductase large subunit [Hordeum vulgare]
MTEDVRMGEPQAAPPPTVAAAAPAPSTLQHLKEIAAVIEAWVLDRFRVDLRSSWSTRSVDSGRSELVDLMKTIRASEEENCARDLFFALWVPDLFMQRVQNNEDWSLFCPNEAPGLADYWGEKFEELYKKYEKAPATGSRRTADWRAEGVGLSSPRPRVAIGSPEADRSAATAGGDAFAEGRERCHSGSASPRSLRTAAAPEARGGAAHEETKEWEGSGAELDRGTESDNYGNGGSRAREGLKKGLGGAGLVGEGEGHGRRLK